MSTEINVDLVYGDPSSEEAAAALRRAANQVDDLRAMGFEVKVRASIYITAKTVVGNDEEAEGG